LHLVHPNFTMMIETFNSSEILETTYDITWRRNSEDKLSNGLDVQKSVLNVVFRLYSVTYSSVSRNIFAVVKN
jgi:hypothetical protein